MKRKKLVKKKKLWGFPSQQSTVGTSQAERDVLALAHQVSSMDVRITALRTMIMAIAERAIAPADPEAYNKGHKAGVKAERSRLIGLLDDDD